MDHIFLCIVSLFFLLLQKTHVYLTFPLSAFLKKTPEFSKNNPENLKEIGKMTLNDSEFNFRKSLDTL